MNRYNEGTYETISLLSDHGQGEKNGWEYDIKLFGQNHIMTDIHAALGLSQVSRAKDILLGRATRSGIYSELLKCDYFHKGKDLNESTFHLASVFLPEYCDRNIIYNIMKERYGIVCNVHFKPLPMMTAYKKAGYNIKHYPNAQRLFERELTLPLYNSLSFEQIEYIADSLNNCIKGFEE